jgi:hypothetical protein
VTTDNSRAFFDALSELGDPLAVKLYRLHLEPAPAVPILPCLDHEALLHEGIAPHAAAYVRDPGGNLHEVVHTPKERRIDVESVSTMHECTPEAHQRFVAALKSRFADAEVRVTPASWLKGDKRVANAVRAQVSLRDVLTGDDFERTRLAIDRLKIISSLMQKQSRVTWWGTTTTMLPFLTIVALAVLASLNVPAGTAWVTILRYVLTLLGALLLYSSLKAVHLNEMGSRVWKRSAEYGLILDERQRLSRAR